MAIFTSSRAGRAVGLLVGVLLVAVGLAACSSSGSKARPVDLKVVSTPEGFGLSWSEPGDVQIEVASQTPETHGWTRWGAWAKVPVDGAGHSQVDFDRVEARHRYRFRARRGNGGWSDPVERLYVQTSLPVVRLATEDGQAILDDPRTYRDGRFTLDPGPHEVGGGEVASPARIRGRGNSTWKAVGDKKSYQVDLGSAVSLLGMPAADKWVLLANYFDPSQLRHFAAMQIAGVTDLGWAPEFDWVELYLNDEYAGVYVLSEKIDVGPDAVDLDELNPHVTAGEALTGGYLLQIERDDKDHKRVWRTPRNVQIAVQRPKEKDSNDAQFGYIRDYVDEFEDVLFSDDFTDPEHGYRAWVDVPSFIDYWIVQEVTAKPDAYQDSAYFTKRRGDPKLYFGPVWDFDVGLGSRYSAARSEAMRWMTTTPRPESTPGRWELLDRPWVIRMFEDPWFQAQVSARWRALVPALEEIPDRILAVDPSLEQAKANDMVRWKDTTDEAVGTLRYGDQTDWNTAAYLADWLHERIDWMSTHIDDAHAGSTP